MSQNGCVLYIRFQVTQNGLQILPLSVATSKNDKELVIPTFWGQNTILVNCQLDQWFVKKKEYYSMWVTYAATVYDQLARCGLYELIRVYGNRQQAATFQPQM
jgi:hypothetical protein